MSKLISEQGLCKAIREGQSLASINNIIPQINDLNFLDVFGKSPLSLAVEKQNFEVIKLLCTNGALPDYENSDHQTPRTLAAGTLLDLKIFNVAEEAATTQETDLFLHVNVDLSGDNTNSQEG